MHSLQHSGKYSLSITLITMHFVLCYKSVHSLYIQIIIRKVDTIPQMMLFKGVYIKVIGNNIVDCIMLK